MPNPRPVGDDSFGKATDNLGLHMDFDDDGLEDEPAAPLLPADDRLWRHPSEVAGHAVQARARSRRDPRLIPVIALTSSISVLLTLGVVAGIRPVRTKFAVEQVAAPAPPNAQAMNVSDVVGIAERLRPAIIQVSAEMTDGARRGSGVLYRTDGLLLTAHHVVDGARAITVTLDDGSAFSARVIGGDPDTDIAVLDLDGDDDRFDVARLGTSTGLKVGQAAITIGSPAEGATGPVVSVGVISATGQAVESEGRQLLDMIQTDDALTAGCAGGAVVDAAGVVIGIAAMNVSKDGGTNGYATPIDVARIVADQLVTHGRVTRGWLGVEGDTVGAERAKELAIPGGVVVKAVREGSPAKQAELDAADVIVAVDGERLESMTDLVIELRMRRPGDTVALDIVRGGEQKTVKVTLAEKPQKV
jgi:S1-C subfamily serine protease